MLSYLGHKVTFWPDNLKKLEPYTSDLQQKGIEIMYGNYGNFESFIRKNGKNFQICVVARAHIAPKYLSLVKKNAPQCKIVYETVDLHHLRQIREAKLNESSEKFQEAQITKKTELELFARSDVVIVKSNEEANLLLKENPSLTVAVIPPFQIPLKDKPPSYHQRKDLLFVGSFQHPPNVDSLKYLITKIFPKIKQKLDVKLYVIGSNPPQNIIDLCSQTKDVIFLGYVKDIDSYLKKCRVLVAPLRYGAGVKGKITRSMAYGLAVITTAVGAEGIPDDSDALIIAKDDFAEKTVSVYNDEKLWSQLSNNSLQCVDKYFAPEMARNSLNQVLAKCMRS